MKVKQAITKKKHQQQAKSFLQRVDNSFCLPGKKDVNKYALSDTMSNLYKKFCLEYPDTSLSKCRFFRYRPSNCKLIQWSRRRECLCVIHANMSLLLHSVKNMTKSTTEVQTFSREKVKDILSSIGSEIVSFRRWKRESFTREGRTKFVHVKAACSLPKEEFCQLFFMTLKL